MVTATTVNRVQRSKLPHRRPSVARPRNEAGHTPTPQIRGKLRRNRGLARVGRQWHKLTQESSTPGLNGPLTQLKQDLAEHSSTRQARCTMSIDRQSHDVFAVHTVFGVFDSPPTLEQTSTMMASTGIQGVAGSNPVSPTGSRARQSPFRGNPEGAFVVIWEGNGRRKRTLLIGLAHLLFAGDNTTVS
jgi:hypothetical protein